jgi:lycopene cyclase domain-containing protein
MSYADLALVFLAAAVVVTTLAALVARPSRHWWTSTLLVAAVLLVLTAVFDSLMILTDLFDYDTSALLGWRVLLVPVEDLAWPLVAVLLLPALWELLSLRSDRDDRTAGANEADDAARRGARGAGVEQH